MTVTVAITESFSSSAYQPNNLCDVNM